MKPGEPAFRLVFTAAQAAELEWRDQARCTTVDPDLWFPEKGGTPRPAEQICRSCEPRARCLAWALQHQEKYGVWGGFNERARKRVARLHKAGQSLDDIIADDDARFYAREEKTREREQARWRKQRTANRAVVASLQPEGAAALMHANMSAWIEMVVVAAVVVFLIIRPDRKGRR
jgi:WhiB family redox-sensing transcriptional regulator